MRRLAAMESKPPYSFCGEDWIQLEDVLSVEGMSPRHPYLEASHCSVDVRLSEVVLVLEQDD
jgi:hypothetical protein